MPQDKRHYDECYLQPPSYRRSGRFAAPFESHANELAELREAGELAELREALVEYGVDPRDTMQFEELANRLDPLTTHLVDVNQRCPKTGGASIMLHPTTLAGAFS